MKSICDFFFLVVNMRDTRVSVSFRAASPSLLRWVKVSFPKGLPPGLRVHKETPVISLCGKDGNEHKAKIEALFFPYRVEDKKYTIHDEVYSCPKEDTHRLERMYAIHPLLADDEGMKYFCKDNDVYVCVNESLPRTKFETEERCHHISLHNTMIAPSSKVNPQKLQSRLERFIANVKEGETICIEYDNAPAWFLTCQARHGFKDKALDVDTIQTILEAMKTKQLQVIVSMDVKFLVGKDVNHPCHTYLRQCARSVLQESYRERALKLVGWRKGNKQYLKGKTVWNQEKVCVKEDGGEWENLKEKIDLKPEKETIQTESITTVRPEKTNSTAAPTRCFGQTLQFAIDKRVDFPSWDVWDDTEPHGLLHRAFLLTENHRFCKQPHCNMKSHDVHVQGRTFSIHDVHCIERESTPTTYIFYAKRNDVSFPMKLSGTSLFVDVTLYQDHEADIIKQEFKTDLLPNVPLEGVDAFYEALKAAS